MGGQITNRRSVDGAQPRRGRARILPKAARQPEIGRLWAAIERSVKAIRGNTSAGGAMHKQARSSRSARADKERAGAARFLFVRPSRPGG